MSRARFGDPARRGAATTVLCGASAAGWWLGGRSSKEIAAALLSVALPCAVVLSRAAERVVRADVAARQRPCAPAADRAADPASDPADGLALHDPAVLDVTVLIPARDEERHIGALLADLGRQEMRSIAGPACLRVIVIDDRSTDRTAAVASAAIDAAGLDGWVIRRKHRGRTKGDVLRDVPAAAIGGSALLVVLDADARVGPDFFGHVAEHRAAGHAAFTARRRIAWADRFWLGRLQDDEQALDSWTLAGRIGLGGGGELRGNGMVVTQQALAAAGGWPTGALTEDLELSTALLAGGIRIAWAGDVVLEETAVGTITALARQRLRWAEGSARRFLDRAPEALVDRRAPPVARLELAVYAGQLALPPLILAAACRGLARGSLGPAAAVLGAYVAVGSLLAWTAIERLQEPAPRTTRVVRALGVGAFSSHWLVALPAALLHIALGPETVTFARTTNRLTPREEGPPRQPGRAMTVSQPKLIDLSVAATGRLGVTLETDQP